MTENLPPSKRRRATRACDRCKSRKRRCNGEKPCVYCIEHRAQCTYDAPYTRGKTDHQPSSKEVDILTAGISSPPSVTRWPRTSLSQAPTNDANDGDAGTLSSRARSPAGGESAAPLGQQYLGPTSPFSVCIFVQKEPDSQTDIESSYVGHHDGLVI